MSENVDVSSPSNAKLARLCVPVFILLSGLFALCIVTADFSVSGRPLKDMLFIIAGMDFAFYISIRVYSPVNFRKQLLILSTLFGVQVGLFFLLRVDGVYGNGRPKLTWVWIPVASQRFDKTASLTEGSITVDLTKTTDRDCPSFRGADRSGIVRGVKLSRDWTKPPKQLWRHPIGAGWSSFAVVGNFCVTQEQRGENEAVVCYELLTGKQCWEHLDRARFYEFTSCEGPRATPTIAGGRVYALGATGILNCLDGATGKLIWSVNILQDNKVENRLFGMTASPLVFEDKIIVSPGGRGSSLVAYNNETGKRTWRGGNADASYCSPQVVKLGDKVQILNFNGDGLFGHNAETGSVLWNLPWISNPAEKNNVCQPVVIGKSTERQHDSVFISSSYGMGCALFDVQHNEDGFTLTEHWANQNLKAKFTNVVVRDDFIYGLDEGILVCVDVLSGRRCWKQGRYGHGQLILVGDLLVVQMESGPVAIVEASPVAFSEIARFEALHDRTWNHPVVSGCYLVVRNSAEAACFRLPTSKASDSNQN